MNTRLIGCLNYKLKYLIKTELTRESIQNEGSYNKNYNLLKNSPQHEFIFLPM